MSGIYTDPATVPVKQGRPLLVVDADEVLLAFAEGFDRFLAERGLFLDFVNYRLHGNVRRKADQGTLLDIEVAALLDEFRADLDSLEAVDGARETIAALTPELDTIVLSNVSPSMAPARERNLLALGLDVPLLANSGPKGPAVKTLARRAEAKTFFVDDIAQHHASVSELAPDVLRIHIVGDKRLKPLLPISEHAHLRANDWAEIEAFIREELG